MEALNSYLTSEKFLYLSAGIIGMASVIIGICFLLMNSQYKSFAITMVCIGLVEMAVMFPAYSRYQHKINDKVSMYQNNQDAFLTSESAEVKKAIKSFFNLKLLYGILIIALILTLNFINFSSIFYGIITAIIIHLAMAIAIDNFGEQYTKRYLLELSGMI